MACGLPVVATDVGGLREYVTAPVNGLLTPKGDAEAFANALLEFLRDRERRTALGTQNRRDAVSRFSWAASAARMRDVYVRIIDDFNRRRGAGQRAAS